MRKLYFFLIITISLFSCTKQSLDSTGGDTGNPKGLIPFSDETTLRSFETNRQIIPFDLARNMTRIDMIVNNYYDTFNWTDSELSEFPVVIYGFDNMPLYYDFIVINQNTEYVGTVTVNARKTSAMNIRQMQSHVSDYASGKTKGGEMKIFSDRYGVRYYGELGEMGANTGVATRIDNGETTKSNTYEDDYAILSQVKEVLPIVCEDVTIANQIAGDMEQAMIEERASGEAFWEQMQQYEREIQSMTDKKDDNDFLPFALFKNDTDDKLNDEEPEPPAPPTPPSPPGGDNTNDEFTVITDGEVAWIKEYQDKKAYNHKSFCGPWVAGYILATSYDNTLIQPNQFDKEGYTVQGGPIRGAMTAPCLNNALKDYSNGKININLRGCSFWDAYWHIREGQSVARLLINWKGKDTQWHWTLMYGSFRVKRMFTTNYYFLQADNETLINNEYRLDRNVKDNANYTILQWFDTVFKVNDKNIRN